MRRAFRKIKTILSRLRRQREEPLSVIEKAEMFDAAVAPIIEPEELECEEVYRCEEGYFEYTLQIDDVEDIKGRSITITDTNGRFEQVKVNENTTFLDVDRAGEYKCIYEVRENHITHRYHRVFSCIVDPVQYSYFSEMWDLEDKLINIKSYAGCTPEQRRHIEERHKREAIAELEDKASNERRRQRSVITDPSELEMMFNLCKHTIPVDMQHQCRELINKTGRGRGNGSNMILADILYTCCESTKKQPFLSYDECLEVFRRRRYGDDVWIKDIIRQIRLLDRCDNSGAVFVLVGAPGTGKTEIAEAIAECTNKKFCVVNCRNKNGMEIGGCHKTYQDSCHGEIQQNLLYYGNDCCMLLDEFEKMVITEKEGNPFSLFVSTWDDRKTFTDSFTQVPVPTQNVIWILTVNTIDCVPDYILNRFQENIFVLDSYTAETKAEIAERFIVPKYLKAYKFTEKEVTFTRDGLVAIARTTNDAGARVTAQKIEKVLRAVNEKLERGIDTPVVVNDDFALTALKDTAKTVDEKRIIGF